MGDCAPFDVSDASDATVQAAALTPLPAPEGRRNPHAIDLDLILGTPRPLSAGPVEDDLSVVLEGVRPTPVPAAPRPLAPVRPPAAPADLDSVFAAMRDEALHRPLDEASDVAFTRGAAMVEAGELEQSIEPLRRAARAPRRRFAAATLLAQVYERLQRLVEAIEVVVDVVHGREHVNAHERPMIAAAKRSPATLAVMHRPGVRQAYPRPMMPVTSAMTERESG